MGICVYVCVVSLFFSLPLFLTLSHLSLTKPVVYTILIKVITDLSEVLYILMIAVHNKHL